jgi:cytoskeletal protein CcmA (bactofilin family)
VAALAVAAALLVPAAAAAFSSQSGQNVTVPRGETRAGTFFAFGQVVTIDGDIDGDLVCGANTVTVNGAVRGDVLCAAQTLTIGGTVDGDIRVAGQVVNLNNAIGRNGMVATQSLALNSAGRVGGDLGVLAQNASINGPVTRDVYGAIDSLAVASTVGAINVAANSLALTGDGAVTGDVNYHSEKTFALADEKVGGQVKRTAPKESVNNEEDAARAGFAMRLYWILASLLLGLALVALAPKQVQRVTAKMRKRPGATIGWGLILTLLAPVLVIVLLVTVIGIPLALLVGALWLIGLALSGVLAGIAAGEWFVERAEWRSRALLWATLVGVPLAAIVFSVPVLGWLAGLVACWWAVGGLALVARDVRG